MPPCTNSSIDCLFPCQERSFLVAKAAKTYKNKILILQKRALRLMFFGDYNSHAVPYFVSSSFLPLDLLYFKSVAILMHDISNSLTPTNISNLFTSQSNIHSYNTRSSSRGDYYVKHSRLDIACVAGVRKGRGRELGREIAREGGGRRGTPARKPLFSPSRLLINKNNATVND